MAQASFFYYNPESGSDSRQHDMFTPQPSTILKSSPMPGPDMQHLYMPAIARPASQKSALLSQEPHVLTLETEFSGFDDGFPRTPGLSTTSSAVSSPPHSSYLPTPTTGFFESLAGVKEGCEHEVKSEILASFDFSRAGSPPLTPVFVNPPNVTANQASELLSTSSCPSLSSSPSPPPQQFMGYSPENFCDPRNLLVSNKPAPLINQLDIPTLPAFIPSHDDLLLGCTPKSTDVPAVLEPIPPVVESVSFFDSFSVSDLDSETDFISELSQTSSPYTGTKRARTDSIPFSEDLSDSGFEDEWAMTSLADTADLPPVKKQKLVEGAAEFDFASNLAGNGEDGSSATVSVSGQDAQDSSALDGGAVDAGSPSQQQANRRGRKQSLTDDPSKTFVCTLCSRRFRRQEHLKRHYRSLHTQDKPFECGDCGKKFSRSDNLAQHARTHGNTTIIGLGEASDKTALMSAHLFETAAAISSSSSSSSGSDDDKAAKKRKRDE